MSLASDPRLSNTKQDTRRLGGPCGWRFAWRDSGCVEQVSRASKMCSRLDFARHDVAGYFRLKAMHLHLENNGPVLPLSR